MITKLKQIVGLSNQRAMEGHLPLSRQVLEMLALRLLRGVGPGYYHTAGFWRKELSWEAKCGHLNAAEYRKALARLNPHAYRKLTQHKASEKAMLTLFGVPTPAFLGQLSASRGLTRTGSPLRNPDELALLISQGGHEKLVFKELEGYGGKGVRVIELVPEETLQCVLFGQKGTGVSLKTFCETELRLSSGAEWLVEEYFEQHRSLKSLNPTSVNTVRIWVLATHGGGYDVVTAYLRIGRENMFVDNATSGGIVAPIDLSTGILRPAQDAHPERRRYPHHPDHGANIEGVAVPYWPEVQTLAAKALSLFPHIRFAGLDVAVGETGPAIIELNVSPDREGAAYTDWPNAQRLTRNA